MAAVLSVAALGAAAWGISLWSDSHRVAPFDGVSHRRTLARRDAALAAGDRAEAGRLNTALAADALARARAVHDAWMTRLDHRSGVFPQSLEIRQWNYQNVAADFFCFQYAVSHRLDLPSHPRLRAVFERERAMNPAPGLCRPIDWRHGNIIDDQPGHAMFATSEYLKDGLVGLYDRTGDPAVLERLKELADAVMTHSAHASRFGPIPGTNTEPNGNILQVFSRLTFAAHDRRYAEFAARLADAVVTQMLPRTGGVPVKGYDYASDTIVNRAVHLRDHGNETAVGLSEVYAMAVSLAAEEPTDPAWSRRAERWAGPIAEMYELILSRGVGPDGLLVNRLAPDRDGTLAPLDAGPCDNWGYLLCGALLFAQAAERHGVIARDRLDTIVAAADRAALAVTKTDGLAWEGDHPDGFADSIESAIYIAFHRPALRERLLAWADTQIGHLYRAQKPDGFVTGDYLDGNFIRTAMLYAEARGGSPRGASSHLNLPWDWPRINSWPVWVPGVTPIVPAAPGSD